MKDVDLLINNGINIEQSIELLGDIEMYNETLKDFLIEIKERVPKLDDYMKNEDMNNYAVLVHAMKSDSKYLGFTTLAEISYKHEIESKANNFKFINENYNQLIEEVNRIEKLIIEYLSE